MNTAKLRKVGGSIMLALPPALLNTMKVGVGASVDIEVEEGCLVIKPHTRPSYSLQELLDQCDETAGASPEDQAWLDSRPVGKELV